MVKLIFLLKRKPGITPEQFRAHYENSHSRHAQKYIGHLLIGYHRNYPIFATLNPSEVPPGTRPVPYSETAAITRPYRPRRAARPQSY
jgi:hypothetical protein